MKLRFTKNEGKISVKVENKDFSTADYIEMVKQIKSGTVVEVECGEGITAEEEDSIKRMAGELNGIKDGKANVARSPVHIQYPSDDINPEDIPF